MRFIDLFCGTGAFSLVLERYGFECVFSNDMCKSSEKIYKANFDPDHFILGDLNKIDIENIPDHDLLCAGFPCQPFSIAGKQQGFKDKRSNVFWKILEILKERRPKFIVLENVKNLKSHDKKRTYQTIRSELEKIGYVIEDRIIDTSKITKVPHHRERIYIVGCLSDSNPVDMEFLEDPETKNISEFLEKDVPDKYYYSSRFKVYPEIKRSVEKRIETNTLYQYRRYYVRENKSQVCPTLTANMGSGGHNVPLLRDSKGIRKLTPRECFNLQGFPENYNLPDDLCDSKLYKLAGNAVSVPVVELIAKKLINIID